MRWPLPTVAVSQDLKPNSWDLALIPVVFAVLALLAFGAAQMSIPYDVGEPLPLSLDPANLPYYLLRSALRMAAALVASLAFTIVFAVTAAKVPALEKVLIPILDILQSIPILGFLSITVTGFIALFPGNLLGVECAAIFAIFTSQAWNMAFSLYSSLKTVPNDLIEASDMFHLSAWQRFWRLEMPWGMPGLVWNMMMSVSGGWFFVVASEAISVSGQNISLPGVGSYIALAIAEKNLAAIGWAILGVLGGIIVYDQLIFRPLVAWTDKFKVDSLPGEQVPESWLLTLMQRGRLFRYLARLPAALWEVFTGLLRRHDKETLFHRAPGPLLTLPDWVGRAWDAVLVVVAVLGLVQVALFVHGEVGFGEIGQVLLYGLATTLRVVVLITLASLIWVPIGVWIGQRPLVAQNVQWIAQFMAAFPANLMFPVAVIVIVRFDLDVDVWTSPLMILGTQWYILFNVIAGASAIPQEMKDAAGNLGLTGWLKWKRFYIPAIFPSYVTGAITASGGSWNASIVAELVSWGDTKLEAHGLGAYIARATSDGDFPRIALGIAVMCLFVMAFNRFLWRRLYMLAAERLRLD
ncbi:sulfonate ABC transporter permease [Paramagnetospirillum kuznetsovii]|uniref:Sulfonate ABC transporter permease n=1 Tax=Paramagnetospirillum kuznetsovii TaxID=2053833 RepID=A0A364NW65_9PROT|nr:ABC transporter permease subunit [Paramagnetospirillum kuznetsovii]RAU21318.1 sulfonate ABC transporter permease [Paramagnetospirillum kuznetsovii]